MKILRSLAILLFSAIFFNASAADQPPLVILLGDSIRMNYQSATKSSLKNKAEVWSPKDNCAHTAYTLQNLERWLTEAGREPTVIHINVGLHDMFLNAKTGKTRHTLEVYDQNLRAIFAKLKARANARIIFALTSAVMEDRQAASKGYKRVVRRNEDVDRFNARAARIARETGVGINDLNAFMAKSGVEKVIRESDGIHLSPEGCEIMGREVARVIMEALKK